MFSASFLLLFRVVGCSLDKEGEVYGWVTADGRKLKGSGKPRFRNDNLFVGVLSMTQYKVWMNVWEIGLTLLYYNESQIPQKL